MRVLQASTKAFEFKGSPERDLMHGIRMLGEGLEDRYRELGEPPV